MILGFTLTGHSVTTSVHIVKLADSLKTSFYETLQIPYDDVTKRTSTQPTTFTF